MVKEEVERCQLWQQHRKVFCVSCNYQVSSWQRPSTLFSPLSPSTSKVRRGSTKVGSVSQSDEIRDQCHQHGDQAQKEKPQYDGHDAQSSRPSGKLRRRLWVLRLLRLSKSKTRRDVECRVKSEKDVYYMKYILKLMQLAMSSEWFCGFTNII